MPAGAGGMAGDASFLGSSAERGVAKEAVKRRLERSREREIMIVIRESDLRPSLLFF